MQDNGGFFFRMPGKIKTCHILGSSTGKWWVTLSVENVREGSLPSNLLPVGIDAKDQVLRLSFGWDRDSESGVFTQSAKRLAQAIKKY